MSASPPVLELRMDFAAGQKDPHKLRPQKRAGELNDE